MALGTIAIPTGMTKSTANTTWGNKKVRIRTVQLTSGANYTTGGSAIAPTDVGLSDVIETVLLATAMTTSGTTCRIVGFDHVNGKLLVYTTASAEAANASDQSTFFARLTFIGT